MKEQNRLNHRQILVTLGFLVTNMVIIHAVTGCNNTSPAKDHARNEATGSALQRAVAPPQSSANNFSHPDPQLNGASYVIAQNFVRDYLQVPASGQFPLEADIIKNIGDRFVVFSHVDAQNDKGVKVTEKFICYQVYNGGAPAERSSWKLLALIMGHDLVYIDKSKTEDEVSAEIAKIRTR